MHDEKSLHRKVWKDRRIYPKYEPYPVSIGSEDQNYSTDNIPEPFDLKTENASDFSGFSTDSVSLFSFPLHSPEHGESPSSRHFRPLKLLEGLFSDRLFFLSQAIRELEEARTEREKLTSATLEEIDSEISECEKILSIPVLICADEKRLLERRFDELKRERERQKLSSWRDLVWLRSEIRKLKKQISSIPGATIEKTSGEGNG